MRGDDGSTSWDLNAGVPDRMSVLRRLPPLTILDVRVHDAGVQWREIGRAHV